MCVRGREVEYSMNKQTEHKQEGKTAKVFQQCGFSEWKSFICNVIKGTFGTFSHFPNIFAIEIYTIISRLRFDLV